MRRSILIGSVALASAAWALSAFAKPPADDRPGPGVHPLASARPAGSMPRPRGSADVGELSRRNQARHEATRARLAELESTRQARRLKRLEAFRLRYSAELLHDPGVRRELNHHARRMAFLHRAEFVAKNELEDPKRTQVLERVKRLLEREDARHAKRMQKLRSASPLSSASGTRPGGAAPKGSAP